MNQLLFEGRTLAGIVSSVIRQDALRVAYSRLDWERMFRIADYHKVANVVHLAILGKRDQVPDRWRERFFERYQESLAYGGSYRQSIVELLGWLEARNISCTLLNSEVVREYYPIPETADTVPLKILLTEESYMLVKGYLIDLGYETDQTYEGIGECLKRVSEISVILYYKLPFKTANYDKEMKRLLETAIFRDPYVYIRTFSVENEFIFRMACAAYRYVTDELTMREVLDLQLCHRVWREHIRGDTVMRRLKSFQVEELAEKILRLSYMWFGYKNDTYYEGLPENMPAYDALEERILTRGMVNHEVDEQALKLQHMIQKELDKEKRKEERRQFWEEMKKRRERVVRGLRWAFPDHHYMASIYPKVERMPVLLPFYWIVRGVRLLWRTLRNY